MNPGVLNLWVTGAAVGYAFGDAHGAAIGLAVSSGITLLLNFFSDK